MIPRKTASSADDQQNRGAASASSNHINVEEVEPATRESVSAATGAPTTPHAAMQRPQEMATQRKQRSGKKQKTRKDATSEHSTNQLTTSNVVNTESGKFIQCADTVSSSSRSNINIHILFLYST